MSVQTRKGVYVMKKYRCEASLLIEADADMFPQQEHDGKLVLTMGEFLQRSLPQPLVPITRVTRALVRLSTTYYGHFLVDFAVEQEGSTAVSVEDFVAEAIRAGQLPAGVSVLDVFPEAAPLC